MLALLLLLLLDSKPCNGSLKLGSGSWRHHGDDRVRIGDCSQELKLLFGCEHRHEHAIGATKESGDRLEILGPGLF